jgi:MFS family permease
MSTLTCTAPREAKTRTRLVTGQLALVFLAGFGALASFDLLISVMPLYVSQKYASSAGSASAGLVTGVLLLGTVLAEAGSAYLMNRFGYRVALAIGSVMLGVPALAMLTHDPLGLVVATALIRGFGFGLTTVVIGALVAELLPPERRGEGLGLYGLVDGTGEVVALPAGVWLAEHFGYSLVAVMAAVAAFISLAVALLVRAPETTQEESDDIGLLAGLRHGGQLAPALAFAATAVAAGIVISFLPLTHGVSVSIATAGLFVQALAASVTRWWAGRIGDRHGHARLMVPALVIAAAGLGMMVWPGHPALVMVGMCLFGAGFGIMQNATLALMMDRVPTSLGTANALWNLAYDGGYGAGPAAFGLMVAHTGFPAGFGLTGALILLALPVIVADKHHRQL